MIEGFRDQDRSATTTGRGVDSDLEAITTQLLRMLILLAILTCAHGFHVASPSMSRIGMP